MKLYVDDWGMTKGINEATLKLAKRGHIAGVSILSESPFSVYKIEELKKHIEIEIGLHLDLTHNKTIVGIFKELISNQAAIAAKLRWQLQKLKQFELDITYIDGHHHIHLFPGIKSGVFAEVARLGIKRIRIVNDLSHPLSWLLGKLSQAQIQRAGLSSFEVGYLTPKVLLDQNQIEAKFKKSNGKLFLVHIEDENFLAYDNDLWTFYRTRAFQNLNRILY